MICTIEKFREYVETELTDAQIKDKLQALETTIRGLTNNNFQKRNRRCFVDVVNGQFVFDVPSMFSSGDTFEISDSDYNDGLFVVGETGVDLIDEIGMIATKVVYPPDVVNGVIEILKWKLNNELMNSGEKTGAIQSESISRHSVTYANDGTETAVDEKTGVPKKLTAFLNPYMKARF